MRGWQPTQMASMVNTRLDRASERSTRGGALVFDGEEAGARRHGYTAARQQRRAGQAGDE